MGEMRPVDRESVQQEVREYIVENFLFDEGEEELKDEDSFLESGLIDSTGILEVIMFLDENYRIKMADDEMVPENLDSIEKIATFVATKV